MSRKIGISMENDSDKLEKSNEQELGPQDEPASVDSERDHANEERNHWVKEIPDDLEMDNEDIVESLDNISVNKSDLPDWINELSPTEKEFLESENEFQEDKEHRDLTRVDTSEVSLDDKNELGEGRDKDDLISDEPDVLDEGFVEISKYDFDSIEEPLQEPTQLQDTIEEQEELPDWLEDMITEEQDPAFEDEHNPDDEQIFMNDEPTKPVQIIEESVPEDLQDQVIEEKPLIANLNLDEIDIEETETQTGESIHIVEFEEVRDTEEQKLYEELPYHTDQVNLDLPDEEESAELIEEIQDYEDFQAQGENWELDDNQPVEIPKSLRFAKYLLDQGEIDPAYQIFQTHIAKKDHLEEIKSWVSNAIGEGKSSQSKLWELLGDIAGKKSDHAEALSAYSRSISFLLNSK